MCERFVRKMVKQKDSYWPPAILRSVSVSLEGTILTASIHENMTVETTGHEVKNYDWSNDQPFNHTWE
jgi:hypothetical protein